MTIRRKLTVAAFVTSTAAAVALLLSPAPKAQAQGQGRGVTISGTIYGTLGLAPEGVPAWIGHAVVSFGNQPPVISDFVDRNTSAAFKKNGISGTEIISLEFTDGSFDIVGRFEVSAGSTPALFFLHETGTIANGKGKYANASGQVSIQGPAVEPPSSEDGVPMWISEIHGVMLEAK
jgi:hypothetical protein